MSDYIVVDLEATCWREKVPRELKEIIEIGTVRLDGETLTIYDEFSTFVRPMEVPILSDFCTRLTTIKQRQVDSAPDFPVALQAFVDWIGPAPVVFCSWGSFDRKQFVIDCRRHDIDFPESLRHHIDLKRLFAEWRNIKRCGMKKALQILDLPLEGTHHRAIYDAKNIARIVQVMFPELIAKGYIEFLTGGETQ